MAITASGLYSKVIIAAFNATQLAIDLSLATHKIALYANTITPDFEATAANAAFGQGAYATGEVFGTGWATGGVALSAAATGATSTSPTLTSTGGTVSYGMGNVAVSATTLTNARGALLYADALSGDPGIVFVNFGADYSTNNGVFGVNWTGGVCFSWDVTP
ncbi:hypothetical protein [Frankia sp. AgB32]|uniref:hypothetical protein n=1 Tax=Frankia sp. AgB32 TaxID=631119 RepID=UPI00200F568F|nr:hypothetical protein [Frankia sp. AgB32]MCK9896967.1 hypothetical protein [Frankia sp. AgB32]